MKKEIRATLFLFLATVLWGGTFPVIKNAVAVIDPTVFVTLRFALGALLLLPFALKEFKYNSRATLKAGMALGLLNGGIYLLQTIGVRTIDAGQAAFIVGAAVVLVPFLAVWFKVAKLRWIDTVAAGACLIGLFIFTGFALNIHSGSWWCLISTICVALNVIYLQMVTRKNNHSIFLLTFYQILFTLPLPAVLSLGASYHNIFTPPAFFGILFCAIFATSLALLLQTKYQHFVNPNKATLIYTLEPVFATVIAWGMHQEPITLLMIIGGIIMLSSTLLRAFAIRQHSWWEFNFNVGAE